MMHVDSPGFVRRYLSAREGTLSRDERLAALLVEPRMKARLSFGQGFKALLNNVRHNGDVVREGEFSDRQFACFGGLGLPNIRAHDRGAG